MIQDHPCESVAIASHCHRSEPVDVRHRNLSRDGMDCLVDGDREPVGHSLHFLTRNYRKKQGRMVGSGGRIASEKAYSTGNGNKYDAPGPNGRLFSVINSLH